jgi:hypothetical protein
MIIRLKYIFQLLMKQELKEILIIWDKDWLIR